MPPQINRPWYDLVYSPWQRLWRRVFPVQLKPFKLYMIRPDPDLTDRVGCDDEIVEVTRTTTAEYVTIEGIYRDLLSLHEREYSDGLVNALWASRLTLERAYVDGHDIAQISLSGTLVSNEICSAPRIKAQLERPALQVRSGTGMVRAAHVVVNGRSLDDVLAS